MTLIPALTPLQHLAVGLIFVWGGFVRTGLGFGGAALALPLLLLVVPDPLLFLPLISVHLLFFATLTLAKRLKDVDWAFLLQALQMIALPFVIGLFGLLKLPGQWLAVIVFGVTLVYALAYLFNYEIRSDNRWADRALLGFGGYVSGTSLIGAPLIVAVFSRHIAAHQLRNTLFALWILLVTAKMTTFIGFAVPLYLPYALLLLPLAGIGHYFGLKAHEHLLKQGGQGFQRALGGVMILVAAVGLWQVFH